MTIATMLGEGVVIAALSNLRTGIAAEGRHPGCGGALIVWAPADLTCRQAACVRCAAPFVERRAGSGSYVEVNLP